MSRVFDLNVVETNTYRIDEARFINAFQDEYDKYFDDLRPGEIPDTWDMSSFLNEMISMYGFEVAGVEATGWSDVEYDIEARQ